jgi:predicted DNA-binding transcriptional regulator
VGVVMDILRKLAPVLSVLVVVSGWFAYVDSRYAHSGNVQMIERRLDKKILEDDLRALKKKLWQEQDRAEAKGEKCKKCREIEADIEKIEREIKEIGKGK